MTPEEYQNLKDYMESGRYLPKEFRDFHDQKDVFKHLGNRDVKLYDFMPPEIINWRQGQIYVIDHFLWFMAKHGFELKKVKSKITRFDLYNTLENGSQQVEQEEQ